MRKFGFILLFHPESKAKVGQCNASTLMEGQQKLQMAKASLGKESENRGFCWESSDCSQGTVNR